MCSRSLTAKRVVGRIDRILHELSPRQLAVVAMGSVKRRQGAWNANTETAAGRLRRGHGFAIHQPHAFGGGGRCRLAAVVSSYGGAGAAAGEHQGQPPPAPNFVARRAPAPFGWRWLRPRRCRRGAKCSKRPRWQAGAPQLRHSVKRDLCPCGGHRLGRGWRLLAPQR